MKKITLFLLFFFFVSGAYSNNKISNENWINHPEIVKIRNLFKEINALKASGKLVLKERKFDYCQPYYDTLRRLYLTKDGKPAIYYYEDGSDDSAVNTELFYDSNAVLRFVFIKAGAYNGTSLEHRIYFSASGERIWEIQKLLEGPGYTFPHIWPDSDLPRNPEKEFLESNPCTEYK